MKILTFLSLLWGALSYSLSTTEAAANQYNSVINNSLNTIRKFNREQIDESSTRRELFNHYLHLTQQQAEYLAEVAVAEEIEESLDKDQVTFRLVQIYRDFLEGKINSQQFAQRAQSWKSEYSR